MGAKGWRFNFGWLCILATAVPVAPCIAQNPPPPAAQVPSPAAGPNAQGQVPGGCSISGSDVSAASIVQATGESLQRKRWQPRGGVIQFTVKSFKTIPEKASFFVCFRWKTTPGNREQFDQSRPDRLDRNNDGTTWTVITTVPHHLRKVPEGTIVETTLPFVPLADVRIVAINEDKTLAADVTTTIGITRPWAAILFSVATIVIVLVALTIIAQLRLKHEGIKSAFWFLRIISTPSGYASLSQLQIVLWTLVVAASAVYVMALSGDLIEVTNGTLVLLGIAGAAALGAKAHSESQNAAAQAAAATARQEADKAKIEAAQKAAAASAAPAELVATAEAEKDVADKKKTETDSIATTAKARADAIKDPPRDQTPQWSDLIVNETTKIDGTKVREIDVARFQMLLFTLITAAFVLMNVVTTYLIPEIPTGFLTLMGISNGVYLGAKVAQGS
jgi:Membrane protein involved in colicin uptake